MGKPHYNTHINDGSPSSHNSKEKFIVEPAEVVDVIMNSSHPKYKIPSDIGAIIFRRINYEYKSNVESLSKAHMADTTIRAYPIKHEIVNIYQSLVPKSGIIDKETGYYYSMIYNVWGETNHNALPFSTQNVDIENKTQLSDFVGIQSTATDIKFGEYFKEDMSIPLMTPFEGDKLIMGRFGQFIRFGSSLSNASNWTSDSPSVNPITIIDNTYRTTTSNYILEDINSSESTTWMTSNQQIDIQLPKSDFKSYIKNDAPNMEYTSPQIIHSSSRIILKSSESDILLNSKKSIGISAKNSVNLESDKYMILESKEIFLGKKSSNKSQPIVLGMELLSLLGQLIDTISSATYVANGPMMPPALPKLILIGQKLRATKSILSKSIYVK